jgi:hypothetical protein
MKDNNNPLHFLIKWLKDPFGRAKVVPLHEPILEEMKQTSEDARDFIESAPHFPIARTVGNPKLRRKYIYEQIR